MEEINEEIEYANNLIYQAYELLEEAIEVLSNLEGEEKEECRFLLDKAKKAYDVIKEDYTD